MSVLAAHIIQCERGVSQVIPPMAQMEADGTSLPNRCGVEYAHNSIHALLVRRAAYEWVDNNLI